MLDNQRFRFERNSNRVEHGIIQYRRWAQIKQRCFNPKHPKYRLYGGKGVTMYPEWVVSFTAFKNYMDSLPHNSDKTVDRIDNEGSYVPGNVRWASMEEQARNKSNNRIITFNGKKWVLAALAADHNVNRKSLWNCIFRDGYKPEEAIRKLLASKKNELE